MHQQFPSHNPYPTQHSPVANYGEMNSQEMLYQTRQQVAYEKVYEELMTLPAHLHPYFENMVNQGFPPAQALATVKKEARKLGFFGDETPSRREILDFFHQMVEVNETAYLEEQPSVLTHVHPLFDQQKGEVIGLPLETTTLGTLQLNFYYCQTCKKLILVDL